MKTQLSMTTLKQIYRNVFSAGYCDLQKIMRYAEPRYYNAGVYGWNNDTYIIYSGGESVAISAGYRNTRGPHIRRDELTQFDRVADEIESKYSGLFGVDAYERKVKEYDALRESFAAYLLKRGT